MEEKAANLNPKFMRLISSLGRIAAIDFGIQTVGFLYSAYHKTEKIYDLTGSLTYHLCLYSLWGTMSSPRQFFCYFGTLFWSARLGSYLYSRVQQHPDTRFDKIKVDPAKFAAAWFVQGVWVFATALPVFMCVLSKTQPVLNYRDAAGALMWITGFGLESIADYQKMAFKKDHPDDYVNTGLYRYSRYPNYFGEILLWSGMWLVASSSFRGLQYLSILSPLFVAGLIHNVSGVKLAEASQAKRYGQRKDFQEYHTKTSMYIPWFPASSSKKDQ